ncbi:efflux RND transporter periplasmic adaptor subunit [Candidatus Parcubacteria bacterium]|nr:efflux RND transporter periplasmic adaptor subunit [Candidatus Parcubacteria bacterium]
MIGIKEFLKKPKIKAIIGIILILGAIASGINAFNSKDNQENLVENNTKKHVNTIVLNDEKNNKTEIKAIGLTKANAKIDVVSMGKGTARGVYFEIGDKIKANKSLVSLSDNLTIANLISAQTNYANMQNNLNTSKQISADNIRQAEIAVKSAEQQIKSGKIALKTTEDNLRDYQALNQKNIKDTKDNAVISFDGYLNIIFNALDNINDILPINNETQIPHIEYLLGAQDMSSVGYAKTLYITMKNAYENLETIPRSSDSILNDMAQVINNLKQLKELTNATITVLDNTISSSNFSDIELNAQKSRFSGLRAEVVNSQSMAERELQILQNLDLLDTQQITALENARMSATSNLANYEINYLSAKSALESAGQTGEQRIISAKTALDNARSQLNLTQIQASDLQIKTPISGQITNKYIEVGTEVNIGMKIAEISQTDILTIEADLLEEDIKIIDREQKVIINNNLKGIINRIYPTADANSKKVKVEIIFDNSKNDLIAGSFVDVLISKIKEDNLENTKIFIPLRALTITQNESFVFVVNSAGEEQIVKKIIVKTGILDGTEVEIIDGLQFSDEVVVDGNKNIGDGEKIIIK